MPSSKQGAGSRRFCSEGSQTSEGESQAGVLSTHTRDISNHTSTYTVVGQPGYSWDFCGLKKNPSKARNLSLTRERDVLTLFRTSWERRGWDSNPRGCYPYTISSRAQSTELCHLSTRPQAHPKFKGRRTGNPFMIQKPSALRLKKFEAQPYSG